MFVFLTLTFHIPFSTAPILADVTMVTTLADATRVVALLRALPDETFHACDTETTGAHHETKCFAFLRISNPALVSLPFSPLLPLPSRH